MRGRRLYELDAASYPIDPERWVRVSPPGASASAQSVTAEKVKLEVKFRYVDTTSPRASESTCHLKYSLVNRSKDSFADKVSYDFAWPDRRVASQAWSEQVTIELVAYPEELRPGDSVEGDSPLWEVVERARKIETRRISCNRLREFGPPEIALRECRSSGTGDCDITWTGPD